MTWSTRCPNSAIAAPLAGAAEAPDGLGSGMPGHGAGAGVVGTGPGASDEATEVSMSAYYKHCCGSRSAGGELSGVPSWWAPASAVLSWVVFAVVDDPLGITTAFSAGAGTAAIPFLGSDMVWHSSNC